MHQTAFIITSVKLDSPDAQPTDAQLHQAARQAITIARKAQTDPEGTDYESFALGSRQFRFIQGEHRTNSEQFNHLTGNWPNMSHEVMSQIREPDLSDAGIAAIPMVVLHNSWNTARRLVSLALENPGTKAHCHHDRVVIYPQILLDPYGIVGNCITLPDENVFGETNADLINGNAVKATVYTANRDPGYAYFLAQRPMRNLEQAMFECDYIRHLTKFDEHIVLEADWNM